MQYSWNYEGNFLESFFFVARMPTLRGCIFGEMKGDERERAARGDDESARRPTRKAARISGPFDEMPNVPLFTQQRRSNTGSCPFPRSRGTSRTWGEIPERSRRIYARALSCGFTRLPENTTARQKEKKKKKRVREKESERLPQRHRGKLTRDIVFYRH